MKWYQIDKRETNGELIEYKIIRAKNRKNAIYDYLVNANLNINNYAISEVFINGSFVLSVNGLYDKECYYEVITVK